MFLINLRTPTTVYDSLSALNTFHPLCHPLWQDDLHSFHSCTQNTADWDEGQRSHTTHTNGVTLCFSLLETRHRVQWPKVGFLVWRDTAPSWETKKTRSHELLTNWEKLPSGPRPNFSLLNLSTGRGAVWETYGGINRLRWMQISSKWKGQVKRGEEAKVSFHRVPCKIWDLRCIHS